MFRICNFILVCKNWIVDPFWKINSPLLISDWCAKIYEAWQYGDNDALELGYWEKVIQETSMLDLTGNKNNEVSSVRVHPGCTLKLFNEHNNVGLLDSLTANVTFLSAYNDQVSSLSCTCQGMIFRTLKTDSKKVTLNWHCFFLRVWPIRVCHLPLNSSQFDSFS